jgi:hypothetical protein
MIMGLMNSDYSMGAGSDEMVKEFERSRCSVVAFVASSSCDFSKPIIRSSLPNVY